MRTACLVALLLALSGSVASAASGPSFNGPESAGEKAFVASIRADLTRRYATAAAAVRSGYVRYSGVDETGAISYANGQWRSVDPRHPSQLWYDRQGRLLGADYSIPLTAKRPHLWGVNPGRWATFDGHIHWVTKGPSGSLVFDRWMPDFKVRAAGFDPAHPTPAALRKMHEVASESEVVAVFHFPPLWDLSVWILPNPNGAFAASNPAPNR